MIRALKQPWLGLNDIMLLNDQGGLVLPVLQNLSASFESVKHYVLFSRLKDMFGLSGAIFEYFQSYLEQSFQRMSAYGTLSDVQLFVSGVPQSSGFGPLVFTIFTCCLVIIA